MSNNLKAVLEKIGLSQDAVAAHCKVSKSCVSNWANAAKLPVKRIPELMEFIGCSKEELTGSSGSVANLVKDEYRRSHALMMMSAKELMNLLLKNIAEAQHFEKEHYGNHLDAMLEIIMEMKMKIPEDKGTTIKGGIDRKERTEGFLAKRKELDEVET